MALQLGALRDALLAANVPPDKADRAAEELAGYEREFSELRIRLGRLTIAVQIISVATIGILISQFALWNTVGKIDGQLAGIGSQLSHIEQLVQSR